VTGSHALRRAGARRLAGAYTLGELSDSLVAVGLALLVLDKTGSVVWTTAYFVLAKGLPALVAPAITAALDRHAFARLEWLYGGQALLIGAMCAVTLPGFVLPVAALAATCALPARSLTRAQIARRLVGAGLLREGNSFVNIAFAAAATIGAAGGGALVAAAGYRASLIAGAVAALCALPLVRGVRGRGTTASWRDELRNGLEYARSTPGVRSLLWLEGIALLAFTLVIPIEVLYAERSLDVGAAGYGALIAAWGAGIFAGGFAFAVLRQRRLLMLAAGATCVIGAAYVGLALVSTLLVACVISFAGGAGNGIQWVAVVTALQESVPDEYQARVVGLLDSAATLAPVIAYTIGGALAQTLSPRAAYAVAGVGTLMCAVAFARVAMRENRTRVERPLVPEAAS
jgi:predicted MFS family arabinose efflux permease